MSKMSKYCLVALVVGAVAVRFLYAYVIAIPNGLVAQVDPAGYHLLATNLLYGRGFCLPHATAGCLPNVVRVPLYPAFMAALYALFNTSPVGVVVAQILLDGVTLLLVGWTAKRLSGAATAGLLAMGLYALNPNAWLFASALLTESVLAFVLMALFALLVHGLAGERRPWTSHHAVATGVLCGAAVLIKPNLVFLPALLGFVLLVARRPWRHIALALCATVLLLAPWLVRNQLLLGRPVLSTAFTDNLGYVSAVATLFYARDEESHPFTAAWEDVYHGEIVAVAGASELWPRQVLSAADEDAQRRAIAQVAWGIVRTYPFAFWRAHWDGVKRPWRVHEQRAWYRLLTGRPWGVYETDGEARLGRALYLFWRGVHWLVGVGCAVALMRYRRQWVLLGWVVLLAFGVTFVAGVLADLRFRFPVEPLLLVLCGCGLDVVWGAGWAWCKRVYGRG